MINPRRSVSLRASNVKLLIAVYRIIPIRNFFRVGYNRRLAAFRPVPLVLGAYWIRSVFIRKSRSKTRNAALTCKRSVVIVCFQPAPDDDDDDDDDQRVSGDEAGGTGLGHSERPETHEIFTMPANASD